MLQSQSELRTPCTMYCENKGSRWVIRGDVREVGCYMYVHVASWATTRMIGRVGANPPRRTTAIYMSNPT